MGCNIRLPSEALPVQKGDVDNIPMGKSVIYDDGRAVTLLLRWRKNTLEETRITRTCWCSQSRATCPVHVMRVLLDKLSVGAALFPKISKSSALVTLRRMLAELDVPMATSYGTHDLRRGHARDLQSSGALLFFEASVSCYIS